MQITEHFKLEEFSCHGIVYPVKWIDDRLWPYCKDLEVIRYHVQRPLKITSGYRNKYWNEKAGGVKKSYHLLGLASDFRCINKKGIPWVSPKKLGFTIIELIEAKKIRDGGLGIYRGHVHYDHGKPRRW